MTTGWGLHTLQTDELNKQFHIMPIYLVLENNMVKM